MAKTKKSRAELLDYRKAQLLESYVTDCRTEFISNMVINMFMNFVIMQQSNPKKFVTDFINSLAKIMDANMQSQVNAIYSDGNVKMQINKEEHMVIIKDALDVIINEMSQYFSPALKSSGLVDSSGLTIIKDEPKPS